MESGKINQTMKDYRVQYRGYLVDILNNALEEIRKRFDITNSLLEKIGKAVSPYATHTVLPDEVKWFGKLEYRIDGEKLAILFPRANEGPINILSSKKIPMAKVKYLINEIANQARKYSAVRSLSSCSSY